MYAIIHTIEPFDSSLGTEIKFTWKGNQIFKVRCIIKNNETGLTVYDQTVSTMKQSYVILPGSGLVNGTYYVANITVFDVNNTESDLQNIGTPFYCLSKPVFDFSVSDGSIIQTSTYRIGVNYSQSQNEPLDTFSVSLYTYQKTPISSSGNIYDTSEMSHVISGLENAKQYYLRATGKTIHGMMLDSGFILITVSYTIAQVFNTLELNNKSESGAIELKSNIISTIGLSEKDVIYIGNEYADLRDNRVTFDEGFEVKGDFSKIFVFYEPERNKSIISFGDGDNFKVDIFYRIGSYSDSNGKKAYFELVANSCGINYVMNSNYVEVPSSYQQFALLVNRKGSYYEMKVVLISQHIRYSPNANGSDMTEGRQSNSRYVGIGYMPREVWEHPNLYTGTKDFNGVWRNLTSWTDNGTHEGFKVKKRESLWGGLCQNIANCKSGETYTLSAFVKYSNYNSVNRAGDTGIANNPNVSKLSYSNQSTPNSPGSWVYAHYTVTILTEGLICPSFELRLTGELEVCAIKLESGTIATPWTPAPSDWLADPTNYQWVPIETR